MYVKIAQINVHTFRGMHQNQANHGLQKLKKKRKQLKKQLKKQPKKQVLKHQKNLQQNQRNKSKSKTEKLIFSVFAIQ